MFPKVKSNKILASLFKHQSYKNYPACRIPAITIPAMKIINDRMIRIVMGDSFKTVPQYLQRFVRELTIFPHVRHRTFFIFSPLDIFFLKIIDAQYFRTIIYSPSIAFFSFGSSVRSPSQIEKTAFLNSSPGIVPFNSLFI